MQEAKSATKESMDNDLNVNDDTVMDVLIEDIEGIRKSLPAINTTPSPVENMISADNIQLEINGQVQTPQQLFTQINPEAQPSVVLSKNEDMKPIFKAYPFTHTQFQAVQNVPYEREKYKLDKEVNNAEKILQEVKMINKESKDNNPKITIDASINLQTEDIREIKESSNVLLSNRNVEKRVVTKRKRVQVS